MTAFRRNVARLEDQSEGIPRDNLLGALGISRWKVPDGYEEVNNYPLRPPFSYCIIARNVQTSEKIFIIDELHMDMEEKSVYEKLREILERELEA
ncbi:MAG: hypothetical protein PVH79_00550, partial [Candidatus Bathyarchaeota archaeon]